MAGKLVLYLIFALICTGINLGSQLYFKTIFISHAFFDTPFLFKTLGLWGQMITGTVLSFIVKFTLDKNFVFKDRHRNPKHTLIQFLRSSSMAMITTAIFFTFELGFHTFFEFDHSELVGGSIGLAIGYVLKFFLDRKFVFPQEKKSCNQEEIVLE